MRARLLDLYNRSVQRLLDAGLIPRFRFLKSINRSIRGGLAPGRVTINGHVMYLDPVDSLGLAQGHGYEPLETEAVQRNVTAGMRVLDVGANIGYFTLLFARLVGPEGSVVAIEPDPDTFGILGRNISANGYGMVRTLQRAAGDAPGVVRLYRPLRSAAHSSLAPEGAEDPFVDVEMVCIDDVAAGPIDFIKIDVEGAELAALRGAAKLLACSPALVIMTEFNPRALDQFGTAPREYLEFLAAHGFGFHDLDRNEGAAQPRSIDDLAAAYTVANGRYTNLLCRRTPA